MDCSINLWCFHIQGLPSKGRGRGRGRGSTEPRLEVIMGLMSRTHRIYYAYLVIQSDTLISGVCLMSSNTYYHDGCDSSFDIMLVYSRFLKGFNRRECNGLGYHQRIGSSAEFNSRTFNGCSINDVWDGRAHGRDVCTTSRWNDVLLMSHVCQQSLNSGVFTVQMMNHRCLFQRPRKQKVFSCFYQWLADIHRHSTLMRIGGTNKGGHKRRQ